MGPKTIMVDLPLYSRLSSAKKVLSSKSDRKLTFSDLFRELLAYRIDLLDIDGRLKNYITGFSEQLSTLGGATGAILFGSVAKGSFNENSDIDIMILVDNLKNNQIQRTLEIIKGMKEEGIALMNERLPSLINPLFLSQEEITTIRPIFFDIVDYGICLFERWDKISSFRFSVNRVKRKRESINNIEVLTWQ